jgi:DNA repair exonuclease SbcCD nuclease subunit
MDPRLIPDSGWPNAMLIAHIADLHLGRKSAGDPEGAGRLNSFRQALATLAGFSPDVFLLAGDTFDGPKMEAAIVEEAAHSLCGVRNKNGEAIPTVIIPGNHDPADADKLWTVFQDALGASSPVHLVRASALVELADGKLLVEAYPCPTRFSTESPWEARLAGAQPGASAVRIVLAHGTLQGGPVPEGETDAYPFSQSDLQALAADYVALGHFHGLYPPWGDGDECQRSFCYCGTHEADQFGGEAGYAVLATVAAGQPTLLRRIKTGRRQWQQLALRGLADLDQVERLLEEMKASADPARYVIRLKVGGGTEWSADGIDRLERLEKALRALGAQLERRGVIRALANLADIDLPGLSSGAIKEALLSLRSEIEQAADENRREVLAAALQIGWEKVHDSE